MTGPKECPIRQLITGILEKVVSVSMNSSIEGCDGTLVALHVMSGHTTLPLQALKELLVNRGQKLAGLQACLTSYGWEDIDLGQLSDGNSNFIGSLSASGLWNTSTLDDDTASLPTEFPPVAKYATPAGNVIEGGSEGIWERICGAYGTPKCSPLMQLARHSMAGSGVFTTISIPGVEAPMVAVQLEQLNIHGEMYRVCLGASLDILKPTVDIVQLLQTLYTMGKCLPLVVPDTSDTTMLVSGVKTAVADALPATRKSKIKTGFRFESKRAKPKLNNPAVIAPSYAADFDTDASAGSLLLTPTDPILDTSKSSVAVAEGATSFNVEINGLDTTKTLIRRERYILLAGLPSCDLWRQSLDNLKRTELLSTYSTMQYMIQISEDYSSMLVEEGFSDVVEIETREIAAFSAAFNTAANLESQSVLEELIQLKGEFDAT